MAPQVSHADLLLDVYLDGRLVHTLRLGPETFARERLADDDDAPGDPAAPGRPHRRTTVWLPRAGRLRLDLDLRRPPPDDGTPPGLSASTFSYDWAGGRVSPPPPVTAFDTRRQAKPRIGCPKDRRTTRTSVVDGGTWGRCRGPARPDAPATTRCRMWRENPLWGAPRVRDELRLLGHDVAASTLTRYVTRRTRPPSPTWRSFLRNHAIGLASVDFFVVPIVTFRLLYAFVVLCHDRRRVAHFNLTAHPTAAWVAQQVREAFPFGKAPRYLIRDRDAAYGNSFREALERMGIEEVLTAPRSLWQSPYVERLIGSVRRECLDHVIVSMTPT